MRKLSTYIIIVLLIAQLIPLQTAAEVVKNTDEKQKEEITLFANEIGGEIKLYKNEEAIETIALIPDETIVEFLSEAEKNKNYSIIRYTINKETSDRPESERVIEGYVHNDHIVQKDDLEEYKQNRNTPQESEEQEKIPDESPVQDQNNLADSQDQKDSEAPEDPQDQEKPLDMQNNNSNQDSVEEKEPETSTPEKIKGYALKQPVSVYTDKNLDSKVLKSYNYGHRLIYRNDKDSDDWFKATVYINGQSHSGYIYASHVGQTENISSVKGVALKKTTSVYSDKSKKSKPLKNYSKGHVLKYKAHDKDWFIATVILNGKAHTGYIYAGDVETSTSSPINLEGVGAKSPTKVYKSASTGASTLKSYKKGSILKYRSFTSNWYEATVYVNGKARIGYIHSNHVETATASPSKLQGVGIKNPTKVFSQASTSASTLKTYRYGSILKYRSYTSNWYKATVYINDKAQTGYIHKSHVGSMNTTLTAYGNKRPTTVYAEKSKQSTKLKSYSLGSKLKFKPYNKEWYKATVYVNGKRHEGYIHTKDVSATRPILNGYAHASPTTVYAGTSKSSSKLKSYSKGSKLKYRIHNSTWYSATIYKSGKKYKGYIHKDDVGKNPPNFTGYAKASPTTVYASTSKKSKKLKSYRKGSKLVYKLHSKNWYIATVIINGKANTGYIHKKDVGSITDISFVNPLQTYTYNNMVADIKSLQKAYPDLIRYKIVGKSEYGRDIYAVSLGKGKATAFINGSHHAREWLTTNLNMYMLENYAKSYKKNQSIQGYNARNILNNTTLWFIPMVNPDGVTLQQRGLRAFPRNKHASLIKMNNGSKNFKRWKANAKGVDLNRQYKADWNRIKNTESRPYYERYKGKRPESASEVRAVLKLINETNPQMAVSYHSSGEILYWNYKQPRSRYYRDQVYARAIGKMTGYRLIYPGPNPSGGGLTDWFIQAKKRPAFTPEISPYVFETNPSISIFPKVWRENQAVGLYVAQESAKLYRR